MTLSPRLAFFNIAATLAYLGLAVLGGGGFAAFFSHPALIALTIVLFAISGAGLFTEGNLSSGEREDRANRWVLPAFGLLGLLAAFLPAYTDRIGFWTLDGESIRWLGVLLFAAGGALRLWPVFVLGRRFSGIGRHPARAYAGHDWYLSCHPQPQLSGAARQLAGMGPRISFRRWCAAHGADDPAAHRAHRRGRDGCCARISAPSMRLTAPAHGG